MNWECFSWSVGYVCSASLTQLFSRWRRVETVFFEVVENKVNGPNFFSFAFTLQLRIYEKKGQKILRSYPEMFIQLSNITPGINLIHHVTFGKYNFFLFSFIFFTLKWLTHYCYYNLLSLKQKYCCCFSYSYSLLICADYKLIWPHFPPTILFLGDNSGFRRIV